MVADSISKRRQDALDRLAKVGPRAAAASREQGSGNGSARPDGTLTLGETAIRLGLAKQELRIVLERPEFSARLVRKPGSQIDLASPTRGALVPEELLAEIKIALNAAETLEAMSDSAAPQDLLQSEAATEAVETTATPPDPEPTRGSQPTEMSLAIIYERLLNEKDLRIADLRAEIEHLRTVLDREQQALARTQALLALQAPHPTEIVEFTDAKFDDEEITEAPVEAAEVTDEAETAEGNAAMVEDVIESKSDPAALDVDDDWSAVVVAQEAHARNGAQSAPSIAQEPATTPLDPVAPVPPQPALQSIPMPALAPEPMPSAAPSRWRFWPWFKRK